MQEYDDMKYYLSHGTVQPLVIRRGDGNTSMFMHHFGRAEYNRKLPILTESIRQKAQPIVDQLNSGDLSENEAVKLLDQIYR